jgi:hypothetical protein
VQADIRPALAESVENLPVVAQLKEREQEFPNLCAAVLALVGWDVAADGECLTCTYCNRTVAPQNFAVAMDAARPFDGAEAQEKRMRTTEGQPAERAPRLDPFREHRWFCCWTKGSPQEHGRVSKPGWEVCAGSLVPLGEDGRRERISAVNVASSVASMLRAFNPSKARNVWTAEAES